MGTERSVSDDKDNLSDEDRDKLAMPEFPPGIIPREDDEPPISTETSRQKVDGGGQGEDPNAQPS
jgi:hypothetical protein